MYRMPMILGLMLEAVSDPVITPTVDSEITVIAEEPYESVLEAAVKKVNMILLEAAELPNMNLDSVTEEMVMSTCLPILMEAVCVPNMILLLKANLFLVFS